MKLHTNTNTITKSENFVESNYSIDATAKAFAILSDGLYSNKILAVVRELSTNAYDSHVAAGCPERPLTYTCLLLLIMSSRSVTTELDSAEKTA